MSTNQNVKTRLGDLLVERGFITQEQLLLAIQEQKTSKLQIGEILVSKGWISNRQIRKTLRVQSKLRNAILTSILSFSPLVLVGCGGGGGQSQVGSDQAVASQQAIAPGRDKQDQGGSNKSKNNNKFDLIESSSGAQTAEETLISDTTITSETSASSGSTQTPESTISADNGATIHLSWDYPLQRVDGSDLEVYEIDSFRLYQLDENGDVGATHVVDGLETEYDIAGLDDGEYHFAVTVVDIDGMESDYSEVLTVSVL